MKKGEVMTYVISDIHGQYDKYMAMLQLINFSADDTVLMINNHIAIDCGCAYGGKLGCVCLETFESFYV